MHSAILIRIQHTEGQLLWTWD